MEYVIATTVSTDEVHLADGTVFENQPGSAGFYALAGMRVFTDRVAVCGGIGPEYLPRHEKWYRENGISTKGLLLRSHLSPTIVIHYFPDGSRVDEPNIGLSEFRALDPSVDEVFDCCGQDTKGVYVFKAVERDYLDALIGGKLRFGYRLMWEISEDACRPEHIDVIEAYLKEIDVFSINRGEAKLLYGTEDEAEAEKRLLKASPNWVFFRRGAEGAHLLADGRVYDCPSVPGVRAVDTTGGGNSSSAAVLYGCCEGYGPQMAGCMGSAAAAVIIGQFGVPDVFTEGMRVQAFDRANRCRKLGTSGAGELQEGKSMLQSAPCQGADREKEEL